MMERSLGTEKSAEINVKDSGRVQKEGTFSGCPMFSWGTEWAETVAAGWNVLVGCDPEKIAQVAMEARPGVNPV